MGRVPKEHRKKDGPGFVLGEVTPSMIGSGLYIRDASSGVLIVLNTSARHRAELGTKLGRKVRIGGELRYGFAPYPASVAVESWQLAEVE